jgi:hypothetical protein
MDPSSPITLVAAGYDSLARAVADYDAVWRTRHERPFHHSCLAVVLQDPAGTSRIERSHNTAESLLWGDAVLGAALSVVLPRMVAGAPDSGDRAGQDAFVGHFRRNIDVDDLVAAALLLDDSDIGLVVVMLGRRASDVLSLLSHARQTSATETPWADLEDVLGHNLARSVSDRVLTFT